MRDTCGKCQKAKFRSPSYVCGQCTAYPPRKYSIRRDKRSCSLFENGRPQEKKGYEFIPPKIDHLLKVEYTRENGVFFSDWSSNPHIITEEDKRRIIEDLKQLVDMDFDPNRREQEAADAKQ